MPGALGALATALGEAGADIEAVEIVEHTNDGFAVDDVLFDLPPGVMPDALVTACHHLDQVRVQWISRYNAGANLRMDLEVVEAMSDEPHQALQWLVDLVPATFRADWALALREAEGESEAEVVRATATAPVLVSGMVDWLALDEAEELPTMQAWDSTLLAGAPVTDQRTGGPRVVVVFGRHGGPAVLRSELARLGYLASLAGLVDANP